MNRYRDLDPAIRAECIHALGQWFKKHPSYFVLETSYLRYVGWTLSDTNNPVRLESVRALSNIYDSPEHIASLQAFTERFKGRFVEMAQRDTDLGVRVLMVGVLGMRVACWADGTPASHPLVPEQVHCQRGLSHESCCRAKRLEVLWKEC